MISPKLRGLPFSLVTSAKPAVDPVIRTAPAPFCVSISRFAGLRHLAAVAPRLRSTAWLGPLARSALGVFRWFESEEFDGLRKFEQDRWIGEALQRCLIELAGFYGSGAKTRLRTIRDELILKFQNTVVPEDSRAGVIEPAISVIESAFENFV
jgi:hypothetical protein